MKDWHLALCVKIFPAGPLTTNKLSVGGGGGRVGRRRTERTLSTLDIWNLDQSQQLLLVFVDDGGSVVYASVTTWDLVFGSTGLRSSAVLPGVRAARPGVWLSVIIACLPLKSLATPDSLWTYYCDISVSGHWCERQSIPALVWLKQDLRNEEGHPFCWEGGCLHRRWV